MSFLSVFFQMTQKSPLQVVDMLAEKSNVYHVKNAMCCNTLPETNMVPENGGVQ